jgi:hypothetical protein
MNSVVLTNVLVMHKEVIVEKNINYLYVLLREKKKGDHVIYFPAIRYVGRYGKSNTKRALNLTVGDVVNINGRLTNIRARVVNKGGVPEYVTVRKTVILLSVIEYVRHVDGLESYNLDSFVDIQNDELFKELNQEHLKELEDIIDKKLEVK